ncbi:hypothetical protein ACXR2T_01580 [Leucobacter sp. HY1910]
MGAQNTEQQLAELRAENARLASELEAAQAAQAAQSAQPAHDPAQQHPKPDQLPAASARRRFGRGLLSTVLIIVGALLSPVAVVSTWAHHQLTDTAYFVETFAPLAEDRAVQNFVAAEAVAAIEAHVDIDQIADQLFDGLDDLGLEPRAQAALTLLKAPAVSGVKGLLDSTVHDFVASDAFATIWREALQITHTQLVNTATGREGAAITVARGQQLQLELKPVIEAVKTQLVAQGFPLADSIPAVSGSIVIAEDASIGVYLAIYQTVVAVGIWLPWVTLIVLAVGVLVARRRAFALAGASGAVLLSMVLVGSGINIGTNVFALVTASTIPHDAAIALYGGALKFVTSMIVSLGTLAAALLVVTLLAGPWSWARTLRRQAQKPIAAVQSIAEQHGMTTGKFGDWLYRWRRPARYAVGIVCAALILLLRPLTPGTIVWIAVLGGALFVAIEALARRQA